jgi:seryl-tRNA(Sec) selenium transferase
MTVSGITRRDLLRRGGGLAVPALLGAPSGLAVARAATAAPAPPADAAGPGLRLGPDIYASIGVRTFVNARGTYTILSGSTLLPEVRAAMEAASRRYVHLDELAEAVGARLAELTGAEWGVVTNGCSAALTLATIACLTGGNPDLHIRIPNLQGFPKDECIIPKHSRNVYDAGVRATGVRVIEVTTADELEAAFGPRTAMVYVLAGPNADSGPLSTKALCDAANRRGVPVLVDAAAEILPVPNPHLQMGAALVAYSGGKCLRGPQAAGLLLGRKDLVKATWVGAAPHHGPARGYKVGKEEWIGMLMAVEMWMKRDHDAEWKTWQAWIDHIAQRVTAVDGVTTSVTPPDSLSNRMPVLQIRWDEKRLGTSGDAVAKQLFDSAPRVSLFPARGRLQPGETGLAVGPYMMAPGDEKVVAERLYAILSKPERALEKTPAPPTVDVTGTWDVRIEYAASTSSHRLHLRQRGSEVDGQHQGDFVTRDLQGSVDGDTVRLRSHLPESSGDSISYAFTGRAGADEMAGEADLGEYLGARFTAKRHGAGRTGR